MDPSGFGGRNGKITLPPFASQRRNVSKLMQTSALEHLQSANRKLRTIFLRIRSSGGAVALSGAELAELRADMRCVSAALRRHGLRDPELDAEIAVYGDQLEVLRQVLPTMKTALLVEKARLDVHREHVKAAADWARARRQTL